MAAALDAPDAINAWVEELLGSAAGRAPAKSSPLARSTPSAPSSRPLSGHTICTAAPAIGIDVACPTSPSRTTEQVSVPVATSRSGSGILVAARYPASARLGCVPTNVSACASSAVTSAVS